MWLTFILRKLFGRRDQNLLNYFDELDLEKVVPKTLQHFQSTVECQSVVWMLKEEFDRLREVKSETNLYPEQTLHRHLRLHATKAVSDAEVIGVLQSFKVNHNMPQSSIFAEKNFVLAPINNIHSGEVIAYLLFVGVSTKQLELSQLRMSKDIALFAKHITFSVQYWLAQKESYVDDLTGLYNQKYLSLVLDNEIESAIRESSTFTVLFMDIDYFKSVNDTRGHFIGSRLLREVGRLFQYHIRRSDYAFRYGGDEFVVVLPGIQGEKAMAAAERLRINIEKSNFIIDGEQIKLTISIGLATFPDHAKSHKEIIKMADEAMYCGKNKSRNIVYVAS